MTPDGLKTARFVVPPTSSLRSDAEEYEPDDAEDQYRQPGGDSQESEHRGTRLGLADLGRGFDDLMLLPGCHGALDP